jgi:hypothetical protein
MKKILFTLLLILSLCFVAEARAEGELVTGTAPVESKHKAHKKVDQTGGLQKGGGVNLPVDINLDPLPIGLTRDDLDQYRGPDVLNKCAFFSSSMINFTNTSCDGMLGGIIVGDEDDDDAGGDID